MILKPEGYDAAAAFTGEYETLEPGGYICVIKKAESVMSSKNSPMISILFDISEGEHKGFYERIWKSSENKENHKWRGTFNQLTGGKSTPFFKGMITAIEESNPGYKWNWDESSLKGKLFGGVFGREQYTKQDGTNAMSVKCVFIRCVDAVKKGITPPADKMLVVSDNYSYGSPPPASYDPSGNFETLSNDDDLPF